MLEKSNVFKESVNLIEYIKRRDEIMVTIQEKIKPDQILQVQNIEKALSGLLVIINKIKATAGDGFQFSDIFAYGALIDDIISVAKTLPYAMEEKKTLNDAEIEYLIGKFSAEGLKLIGIGTGANKYGTEYTELAFMNLADIIILVKEALKNGIGIEDLAVLPFIVAKTVSIIMKTSEVGKELSDLTAEEIAKLLAMLAAKILYIIKV